VPRAFPSFVPTPHPFANDRSTRKSRTTALSWCTRPRFLAYGTGLSRSALLARRLTPPAGNLVSTRGRPTLRSHHAGHSPLPFLIPWVKFRRLGDWPRATHSASAADAAVHPLLRSFPAPGGDPRATLLFFYHFVCLFLSLVVVPPMSPVILSHPLLLTMQEALARAWEEAEANGFFERQREGTRVVRRVALLCPSNAKTRVADPRFPHRLILQHSAARGPRPWHFWRRTG
jgi:hypothetical protein